MRRILVDPVPATPPNGAGRRRVDLESDQLAIAPRDDCLEALDEALAKLAVDHPKLAELVDLRYFVELTLAECSEVLSAIRSMRPCGSAASSSLSTTRSITYRQRPRADGAGFHD
jgi:hypothetical protein